ncbi:MAG: aminotransferase class V-fold PLP-dependent enzyme, partial [Gemmatimonadales bacterium]|nr:aminotransferase class V-fold PLP-dependent enzyme [Gemmatimonadales bacterium]
MTLAPAPAPSRDYRAEFPIFRESIYLNSCSLGALSARSRVRVNQCLDLWESRGAAAWYDVWWAALAELRSRYGRIIGAPEGTVALHPNISTALAAVAESLDYRRRRKVVVSSLDFPTVAYQWLAKPGQVDVEVVESSDGISVPLEAFERAVDDRTALVATSHVYFTSGAIADVRGLAEIAHRRGALLLVDGYQAAGQLPVDVRALDVDFYCAGGLKWLLGGSGVAFLYARAELLPDLAPRATGWFAHREQFRFDPRELVLHDDARRLEAGTPPILPVYAQLGGLDVIEELGVEDIRRRTMALTDDLIDAARAAGLRPKVAADPDARSAIVMLPSSNPAGDVRRLAAARIVTDARPGHVRISPYFYNVADDARAAIECLTRD